MKQFIFLVFLLISSQLKAQQEETKIALAFLKSVQEKNFSLLKPWMGPNEKMMEGKWKEVVKNAYSNGFKISNVKFKRLVMGKQIPNLPLRSIIAVYEYNGKEWDDLLLMTTTDKKILLAEIPMTTYMFAQNEERRGKNLKDAEK